MAKEQRGGALSSLSPGPGCASTQMRKSRIEKDREGEWQRSRGGGRRGGLARSLHLSLSLLFLSPFNYSLPYLYASNKNLVIIARLYKLVNTYLLYFNKYLYKINLHNFLFEYCIGFACFVEVGKTHIYCPCAPARAHAHARVLAPAQV